MSASCLLLKPASSPFVVKINFFIKPFFKKGLLAHLSLPPPPGLGEGAAESSTLAISGTCRPLVSSASNWPQRQLRSGQGTTAFRQTPSAQPPGPCADTYTRLRSRQLSRVSLWIGKGELSCPCGRAKDHSRMWLPTAASCSSLPWASCIIGLCARGCWK